MASSRTTIFLVRHGQSTWNQEHRWQGQADPPLSDFGREQAQVAAAKVGSVDAVISSTQQRAHETACIISDHIGVGPVQQMEGFRERSAGEWSGLTTDVVHSKWPNWEASPYRPKGWEPDESLMGRVHRSLNEVAEQFSGGSVLIVSHSGVLITLERELEVYKKRISNLHGRVLFHDGSSLSAGDRVELLDGDYVTGGGEIKTQL